MPRGPRTRNLTFYLLKAEILELEQAISKPDELTQYDLGERVPYAAKLYVKSPFESAPWWVTFFRQAVPDLEQLFNANSSAAILLRASGRIFAVTFGYGRNLLELDAFERGFGLRVALNALDPDTLRSVDARTFEELTVVTRSQTSRATGLENFRISESQDILKAVTGKPYDLMIGTRITGADAAKVTYAPNLTGLAEKCSQLLSVYGSEYYKQRFGFIDQLRVVSDPARIHELDEEIVRRLKSGELGNLHLAPPEVVDLEDIESFVFDRLGEEDFAELDIQAYLDLNSDRDSISLHELKTRKVGAQYGGAEAPHFRWKLYDCIVTEVPSESRLFVLSGGTWYEVDATFAGQVTHDTELRLGDSNLLPAAQGNENERQYNDRVSRERGYHLLDRKLVTPTGGRSPIEFCDLMTENRQLVHVKRRSRSSTLSHLFSQGVVSAEVFLRDSGFRQALASNLSNAGLNAAARNIPMGRPSPPEWEVVFGIIGGESEGWPGSLPFFSQLNFKNNAEHLENVGYRVSLVNVSVG